ncbi:MAG: hypothetical protein KF757_06975 [Phycisphaeraceae bacterium]|nr:hypothetical protein [Phycisphaeraceae bacterium]MCW5763335.1 hypothetical protein [Phycisphaeraceae bacterium]
MTNHIATLAIAGSLLVSTVDAKASVPPSDEGPKATFTLISDVSHAKPGDVFWIAVQFKIEPEWHIYWPGQNDTGIAPIFNWTLPSGWKIGQPRWTAPRRYETNSDMLDHVLEGSPVILFPVQIAPDAALGSTQQIEADIEWFVCRDVCLAEFDQASLSLTIAESTVLSPTEARVRAHKAALPAAWPASDAPIEINRPGANSLSVSSSLPGVLSFYPAASGRGVLDIAESCQTRSGTLRIEFASESRAPVVGIVHFAGDDGSSYAYLYRDPVEPDARRDGFEIRLDTVKQEASKE